MHIKAVKIKTVIIVTEVSVMLFMSLQTQEKPLMSQTASET